MKLLLSAYACEPDRGSEPGVGWNWAIELARIGHEVHVLTRSNNQNSIEAALGRLSGPVPVFHYSDLPSAIRWWKRGQAGIHFYYLLWQFWALAKAFELHKTVRFDRVHHLTFGVHRQATLMWALGVPLTVGPLGGGETSPIGLRQGLCIAQRLKEWARDFANAVARVDPLVWLMYRCSDQILFKTRDTLRFVPSRFQPKSHLLIEIGIDKRLLRCARDARRPGPVRLIYVGRFIYWKGMALGLQAVAAARAKGVDVQLRMVGSGPEEAEWQRLAKKLKLDGHVDWISWVNQQELEAHYLWADALIFPSLHDSSGNVVLEAMAKGLPVICLDVGGPAEIIANGGGIAVNAQGAQHEVADRMASAITRIATDADFYSLLSAGAFRTASSTSWNSVVRRVHPPLHTPP